MWNSDFFLKAIKMKGDYLGRGRGPVREERG
jgi:hypothetical protein